MKRFLLFLCSVFISTFSFAETETINWYVDNQAYATTTCETGGDVAMPVTPTKYGYTFQGWRTNYTFIEYIESTGTQYINTGLSTGDGDITVTAVFTPTTLIQSNGAYSALFGSDGNFQAAYNSIGQACVGNACSQNSFFSASTKSTVVCTLSRTSNNSFYVDGVDTGLKRSFIGATVLLLSSSPTKYLTKGKLYSFVVVRNNTEIMHLVPARREVDSVVGMFDMVSGDFFVNSGTGQFGAGPAL